MDPEKLEWTQSWQMCVSSGHKSYRKAALSHSQHSLSSSKKVHLFHSQKNFTQKWNPLRIPHRFPAFTKNVIYFKTAQRKDDSLRGWAQSLVVEVAGGWQQLWAWWMAGPRARCKCWDRNGDWLIPWFLPFAFMGYFHSRKWNRSIFLGQSYWGMVINIPILSGFMQ